MVGWLCLTSPSTARSFQRRHPLLLSLAKDVKLNKYTLSTGKYEPRAAAWQSITNTAALRKLLTIYVNKVKIY